MDEIAAGWILGGGRLLTLDPRRPRASALAIAGDRIAAVAGPGDVRRWRGRRTRVVDLRGAVVIPGLVDAHAHLARESLKYFIPSLAPAWVTLAERDRGVLAPGRQADLAVLEQDPLALPLDEMATLTCRLTMVGGRVVHGDA